MADLGIDARGPLTGAQITTVAAWRARREDLATSTARWEATRLARRVAALDEELKEITEAQPPRCSNSPASARSPQR